MTESGWDAALAELLAAWPRAEIAYAVVAGRSYMFGVGTAEGSERAIRDFSRGRRHIELFACKRSDV